MYMKKPYLVGPDKLWTALFRANWLSSAGNTHSLSSTPPVYIHKAHQNTSGSAVSELRFIHHIITYIVPATPRAINWAKAPDSDTLFSPTYTSNKQHTYTSNNQQCCMLCILLPKVNKGESLSPLATTCQFMCCILSMLPHEARSPVPPCPP